MPRILFAAFFIFASADIYCAQPPSGPTFVSASIAEPATLLPVLASDSASHEVIGKVFNGLVRYNPDLIIEPELAESWRISEDGREIRFFLRKDVRWHDGAPFTSADVEFTYQTLINPDVPTPYSGDFQRVSTFTVVNDFEFTVAYDEPFAPALASWGIWILPKHLLKNENLLQTDFARHPVGTGPYIFQKWKSGQSVELRSNKAYFEGTPLIERVVYRVIPDQTTMFMELHQQTVDSIGLTPIQFTRLTGTPYFQQHYRKFRYPSFGYTYLGFNMAREPFDDIRVRQALDYAVNKDEIIESVLYGLGRKLTGPFSVDSWAYDPSVEPRVFNPERSRELLYEAGFRDDDADGILERDNRKFEFTIITNQGNFQRKLTAEIIQRRLREIGIIVHIKVVEWSAFLSEYIDKKNFDAALLAWGLSRDPDIFDIWHSTKTENGAFNFVSFKNPEADGLMERGRSVFDQDIRKDIYYQLHRLIFDESPYLFLYVSDALPVVHSRFEGVSVTPLGIGYDFIRWNVADENRLYFKPGAEG